MIKRFLLSALVMFSFLQPVAAGEKVKVGPDGLHIQDWFYDSQFNLPADLQAAATSGKHMVILFEQNGCIYCKELHEVNFAKSEIVDLLTENYFVVQIDMFGSRPVVDFGGQKMTEAQLARKWDVRTTPTTIVLSSENPFVASLVETEVFRLPGYLPPFQYHTALDFFASGAMQNQAFGAFMQARASALEAQGIDPTTW